MDQDGRFSNKDRKLMKQMTWPPEFSTKVDIKKVDLTVINPWIHRKIIDILGEEDELLINFIISALEQPTERGLDPRKMQIDLTGFLARNTGPFMKELWQLLIDAQNSPNGIPPVLIEERKDEIKQQRQDLEDELSKLENIKAFMSGNKENTSSKRNEETQGIESGRRKEDLSRLANKLKAEKGPSAEMEVEKPREKYREDRDLKERRRDRDDDRDRNRDRGDRDRLREKDRRKERERERERDRDRERDRRRDRERERERRRSPRHERRRSRRSPSSSSGSSSSESRERSESPSKKQKHEKRGDRDSNKQKEKEKQKSRNKKHESSSESESDSGSDSSSDSDSSQSDSSGSDSDNGKK